MSLSRSFNVAFFFLSTSFSCLAGIHPDLLDSSHQNQSMLRQRQSLLNSVTLLSRSIELQEQSILARRSCYQQAFLQTSFHNLSKEFSSILSLISSKISSQPSTIPYQWNCFLDSTTHPSLSPQQPNPPLTPNSLPFHAFINPSDLPQTSIHHQLQTIPSYSKLTPTQHSSWISRLSTIQQSMISSFQTFILDECKRQTSIFLPSHSTSIPVQAIPQFQSSSTLSYFCSIGDFSWDPKKPPASLPSSISPVPSVPSIPSTHSDSSKLYPLPPISSIKDYHSVMLNVFLKLHSYSQSKLYTFPPSL